MLETHYSNQDQTSLPTELEPTPEDAYLLFLEKLREVTQQIHFNYRQNLQPEEQAIFNGFSIETQVKIVAYYLMPNYMAQKLSKLPAHLPIVHHIRKMLSAIQIFDSGLN